MNLNSKVVVLEVQSLVNLNIMGASKCGGSASINYTLLGIFNYVLSTFSRQ